MAELEAEDRAEGDQPGATDTRLREKIEALKEKKREYEGHREALKQSGEKQLSETDPESRLMKQQDGMKVCYNAQIAVDAKHHLIVACDVTNQVNDEQQLAPMAVAAKEALGVEALDVAADAGYHVGTQVVECEANGITPHAPKPRTSSKNGTRGFSRRKTSPTRPSRTPTRARRASC
jgi:transposase